MCGENASAFRSVSPASGSPPRVRGKLLGSGWKWGGGRLTPACAGKTRRGPGRARRPGGSPPRVRGKRAGADPDGVLDGLTPACAGKTRRAWARASWGRAHPRVCGENPSMLSMIVFRCGSPPRVRGKRYQHPLLGGAGRLTPACAGKTAVSSGKTLRAAAHPRVCGENAAHRHYCPFASGSPPRVRGKRGAVPGGGGGGGLTPACAGKTPSPRSARRTSEAHPRVCGENASLM